METRLGTPAPAPSANPASPRGNSPSGLGVQPSDFERAFRDVEPEILAVPSEHLVHITVDVRVVAVNTVARLPRLESLSAQFTEQLPQFDVASIDRLGTYALAAAHAYIRHQMRAVALRRTGFPQTRATSGRRRAARCGDRHGALGGWGRCYASGDRFTHGAGRC
jgi:hypothetical protein